MQVNVGVIIGKNIVDIIKKRIVLGRWVRETKNYNYIYEGLYFSYLKNMDLYMWIYGV